MTQPYKKKLIEVAIPLEAINAEAVKEKNNPFTRGHPRALHQWWARRPNVACRAMLMAQLIDDPSSNLDKYPTEREQNIERERLFKLIVEGVKWENNSNVELFEKINQEIRDSFEGEVPIIYDPFSGGGTIPLEAQRLGLHAIGSDLNPIAVLIGKASIEIAPKFKDRNPVHKDIKRSNYHTGLDGISEDISVYGEKVHSIAKELLQGLYYPASQRGDFTSETNIVGWIWTRTVPSPDPAFYGVDTPISSTFALSTKKGKEAWLQLNVDRMNKRYELKVNHGAGQGYEAAKKGTKQGRGANFNCVFSDAAITPDYVKKQGENGNIGKKLLAVVTKDKRGVQYVVPTQDHEELANIAEMVWRPNQSIANDRRSMFTPLYGMEKFDQLFTDRQIYSLNKFMVILEEIWCEIEADARDAGFNVNAGGLSAGGDGSKAYADAIVTYLSLGFSKLLDYGNTIVSWNLTNQNATHLFTKQAIPMSWDFFELNPIGKLMNFATITNGISKAVKELPSQHCGSQYNLNAINGIETIEFDVVNTDPPYYDNIGYADLSDFFYVWQKKNLQKIFPDLFGFITTPKAEEMVALAYRHETKSDAEDFFFEQIKLFISNLAKYSKEDAPSVIYYAFKQNEIINDGITSAGWATFLQGVVDSGMQVVSTWPVRTERQARAIGLGNNALATSIVLVCRKREISAGSITRLEFIRALKRELPIAIAELQESNISPSDLPQSSIGPGIGIFSRYQAVLETDDSVMSVKTALQLINAELDDFLNDLHGDFDPETRFTASWFEQHGYGRGEFGAANSLATARGISVESVKHAGIIESSAGKVRILARSELENNWDPNSDTHLTIWECCQYLVKEYEENGEKSAAMLLKKIGFDKAETVKDLAYYLYDVCSNKRQDAREATSYNGLIAVWSDLTRLASTIHDTDINRQAAMDF